MSKVICTLGAAALLAVSPGVFADLADVPSGKYTLDDTHGYITFTYSHLGFSNPRVGFNSFDTVLELDSRNPENSKVRVSIDASSIDSRVAEFNEHLNGSDFFNTAEYPQITFTSTRIEPKGANRFDVTGDLTILGTTKPVTLAATINKAANHPMRNVPTVGVSASTRLMRSNWGLDAYVPAVSDEVELSIEVELLAQ
ncbi:MAG: YceI family protein [Woeseiaceae bacterium]|jgi:polyisoprenoid-binding protein YceI